jgi:uncharacterized protein YybS (DUF2232 family)
MSRVENIRYLVPFLVVSLVLFLAGVMVPMVGIVLIPLVPQPLLFLGVKYGQAAVIGTACLVAFSLFWLGGEELALSYLVIASVAVLLLACLGHGRSLEGVVLTAATGFFALAFVLLHAMAGSLIELEGAIRDTLTQNLELAVRIYEKAGLSGEGTEFLRQHSPRLVGMILQILPALAFAGCAVTVLLNLLLLFRRLPLSRGNLLPAGDPKEWKSPELLIWCFIFSGFCLLLLQDGWVKTLFLNLFIVSMIFYFFQGLAIVAYYFHHKNVPVFLRGLGYALIFVEQLFMLLVVGLGLFDLWGDFRRLNKRDLRPTQAP